MRAGMRAGSLTTDPDSDTKDTVSRGCRRFLR
jgi:hypothetical protein